MSLRLAGAAFGFGILLLCVALFLPGMIDASSGDVTSHHALEPGSSEDVTDILETEVNSVNSSAGTANITYTNTRTYEENTSTFSESSTTELMVGSESINVTLTDAQATPRAVYETEHSAFYGWDSGPRVFMENFNTIVALVGFLMILASAFVGAKT